jgi:hypothetical protein
MQINLQPGNLITVLVGFLFIGMGVYGYSYMGRFLDTAKEASAVVVDVVYESTNKKGRVHPVVKVRTAEGQEIVGRSNEHHNVHPGDTVQLLYDPRKPEDIEISTLALANRRRLLFTALSVAVGLGVCGLGLGFNLGK